MEEYNAFRKDIITNPRFSSALSHDHQHLAIASGDGISILNLNDVDADAHHVHYVPSAFGQTVALAWHPSDTLAASQGAEAIVYNLKEPNDLDIIAGNGRAIASLTFSSFHPAKLAIGLVSGEILIYSLDNVSRPATRLESADGTAVAISWSAVAESTLASAHGCNVHIWDVRMPQLPVRTICAAGVSLTRLAYHPDDASLLLASSASSIKVWAQESKAGQESVVGEIDGMNEELAWTLTLPDRILQAAWIGQTGVLVSASNDRAVKAYATTQQTRDEPLWVANAKGMIVNFAVRSTSDDEAELVIISNSELTKLPIPVHVLGKLGWRFQTSTGNKDGGLRETRPKQKPSAPGSATIRPIAVSTLRKREGGFTKTSRQLQSRRSLIKRPSDERKAREDRSEGERPSPASTAKKMTDSLEIPKGEDDESPMPFLSPSIPAKKPSPQRFPSLDDSVEKLLPLPASSLASTHHSFAATSHDSDSDSDIALDDGMRGSGTFAPGNVNVPLPKACGALFATNGQLLTFFPPRPPETREPEARDEIPSHPAQTKSRSVPRVFASFGNLTSDNWSSDSDSSDSVDISKSRRERFTMPPPSWPASNHSKHSPIKSKAPPMGAHKVFVKTFDLEELLPLKRKLASRYRVFLTETETASQLCEANASTAESVGLDDVEELWRLLALVLEDQVPLENLTQERDILVMARGALAPRRSDSAVDLKSANPSGRTKWANHPLGRSWLIERIFHHLEAQGDLQTLALMSGVLAEPDLEHKKLAVATTMARSMASYCGNYFSSPEAYRALTFKTTPVPILRPESGGGIQESPTKLKVGSFNSSRNPSIPTTPHMESGSATPPLGLGLSRVKSMSGSASPEHHRSSFSAFSGAAKEYAQSIANRFPSLGSSPPGKKFSTSHTPPHNELSSSLPLSTYFGKSVSFASTALTARESSLSKSVEQYDDEKAYDSDRTVDESGPPTPKSPRAAVTFSFLNVDHFDLDASSPLLNPELQAKGQIWRKDYAEMIRAWGLATEAAEFEKISGLMTNTVSTENVRFDGVIPVSVTGKRNPCAICTTVISGHYQLCSSCSHTSHAGCLLAYINALETETFECPTGCRCRCANLPSAEVEWVQPNQALLPEKPRRASFTDPRRWRARVEGDSW